ncbi:MAG: phytoene desaturase [Haliscomenobacter sp.]|nr:phytoene desaturase [Haliscomenobacter sp.]
MKIGIIGAGVAGLAAAARLAAQGHEVDVYESNAYPGGKLAELRMQGYRFDAGPSLFTMPRYVDEIFESAGEDPASWFSYQRLPVVCNYFWEDGTRLSAHADPEDFAQEVEKTLGVPAARVLSALADSRKKYELTGKIFLEKSLHLLRTWASAKVAKAMVQIPGLDLFTTMNAVNERYLGHPKLVQLFNRYATYNGSNPYKTPGLLTIIPHFEHHIGAYYPKGGMYAIAQSLYNLALRKGATFHFDTPVTAIRVEHGKATGLEAQGAYQPFDRIVSNMDVFFTYRRLLPDQPQPERILRQEKSTSALIFYWGINRSFPELTMHNIFFSENYREEFDLLNKGQVSDDPTIYVNLTSKHSPEDAPPGSENWFVLVNVPYHSGQDWDQIIARTRANVLQKLSRMLKTDVEALIECEDRLDPRTIESRTSSHLGALYGTSSNNRMAAFLRHPNFSSRIKNLYFCGGSVHPGGGIPLCLLSAKLANERIQESR